MAIKKMKLINIAGMLSDLDITLQKCCDSKCFHIEPAISSVDTNANGTLKLLNEKNPYTKSLKRFGELALALDIKLEPVDYSTLSYENFEEFELVSTELDNKYQTLSNKKQEHLQTLADRKSALKQLSHLSGLNKDFDQVFDCEHVSVRIGKLPIDSYFKLDYYNETFFFVPFSSDKHFYWGMYFSPTTVTGFVDNIFESLYFERIWLPEFVTGTPAEATKILVREINEMDKEIENIEEEIRIFKEENANIITRAYSKLMYKNQIYELRNEVGTIGDKFFIKGFVPDSDTEDFEKLFDNLPKVSVLVKPPDSDNSLVAPTKIKNGWFSKPFSMLVNMYGLPGYKDMNPTTFVAITYTLLFGIMFGDLGQGLVIVIIGFILDKVMSKEAGGIFKRVGVSSMFFGCLYGSVFGFEHLLDPVYHAIGLESKPIEVFQQTNLILLGSVAIGVLLILISMIFNIVLGFKNKDYEKAIFGCNGIAGFVFYSSVIAALVLSLFAKIKIMSPLFVIFAIVIPLICIFCRFPFSFAVKYKKFQLSENPEEATIGNFIVENFFEMFEFILSYVSNTMSFLRVGGF
ncbi:MAG: ATPase, partial [Clostridiales bacterium]|nr:ATPase [Clostridiales bacterium]